ncbi:MAG: BON domain-containing protein [Candidatus Azobacteroides sp.]|nr:BON domain-containing protein [Candidatus Azobacteroides sp.]
MKTKILVCAVALLAGISFYSCKPNDEKIQKEVATVLSSQPTISSEVKNGVVTLSGVVISDEVKAAAEASVKTVKDIKSVVNNIEVKLPEAQAPVVTPDDALTTAATAALTAAGFKDVTVSAKDSVIILAGEVKKAELRKVMQIANDLKPKKVDNSQLKTK